LTEQVSLLNHSGKAKDLIMHAQQAQINALNDIAYRKDMIISNNDAVIAAMEKNITELEHRNWKLLGAGTFAGIVIYGACTIILK
jgi:hypothetical protein